MKTLITGGSGFIMTHAYEHYMEKTDWDIVIVDSITYAGSLNKLTDSKYYDPKRTTFVYHDIRAPFDAIESQIGDVDYIIHAAAMSHVERSIHEPELALMSNGVGTFNVLQFALKQYKKGSLKRLHYISTDEVYGANADGGHKEGSPHRPSNPYSLGKAWGELACYTWSHCYGLPVIVTNTMNNFGERQHPEKFIPMVVNNILSGKKQDIHAVNGEIGSRFWLHARNHADAVLYLLNNEEKLPKFSQFNVVGDTRMNNLEVAKLAEKYVKKYKGDFSLNYELIS